MKSSGKVAYPTEFSYLGGMAGESELLKLLGSGGMAAASAINPAMAIAGAAQPLFQGILGLTQGARARKMSQRYPRPDYMIPGAATNALNDQRNMAMGQSPGLGIAQQQLAQSQAGSAAAIMNSGGGGNETLAALTKLDQNAGDQGLDLAAMQEQYRANEMGKYINQQNAYAQWQEKKRDWDVMQPYLQAQEKAAAMNDAANVNIDEALRTGGGLVAQSLIKPDPSTGSRTSPLAQKALSNKAAGFNFKTGLAGGTPDSQRSISNGLQPEKYFSKKMEAAYLDPAQKQGEGPNMNGGAVPTPYSGDGTIPDMGSVTPVGDAQNNPGGEEIVGEILNYSLGKNLGNSSRGKRKPNANDARVVNLAAVTPTPASLMPSLGTRGRREALPADKKYNKFMGR